MSKPHRHRRKAFRRLTKPGAAPGTLAVDPQAPKPRVRVIAYGESHLVELEIQSVVELDRLPEIVGAHSVTWINVEGLGDLNLVRKLGQLFHLHPLALEDALNRHQRAKIEPYEDQLFIVARMPEGTEKLENDQLGMFVGRKFVITFQHLIGDCFDPLRDHIRQNRGILRSSGPDYLAYAILDGVVDSYFPVLETFGEEIDALEDAILQGTDPAVVSHVHDVKAKLLLLRRAAWPLREALNNLVRDPSPLITPETRVYLRDCADHAFQIMDLIETYRDITSDLMELYHSALSTRTNEIMKVLTIIATIFIPLTFIVGVYGMNFNTASSPYNMPELNWYWGYPAVWAVMLVTAAGMLWFFQKKGWLNIFRSKPRSTPEPRHDGV